LQRSEATEVWESLSRDQSEIDETVQEGWLGKEERKIRTKEGRLRPDSRSRDRGDY